MSAQREETNDVVTEPCIPSCAAAGPATHTRGCHNHGKWPVGKKPVVVNPAIVRVKSGDKGGVEDHYYGPFPNLDAAREAANLLEETESYDVIDIEYGELLSLETWDYALQESQKMHAEMLAEDKLHA